MQWANSVFSKLTLSKHLITPKVKATGLKSLFPVEDTLGTGMIIDFFHKVGTVWLSIDSWNMGNQAAISKTACKPSGPVEFYIWITVCVSHFVLVAPLVTHVHTDATTSGFSWTAPRYGPCFHVSVNIMVLDSVYLFLWLDPSAALLVGRPARRFTGGVSPLCPRASKASLV